MNRIVSQDIGPLQSEIMTLADHADLTVCTALLTVLGYAKWSNTRVNIERLFSYADLLTSVITLSRVAGGVLRDRIRSILPSNPDPGGFDVEKYALAIGRVLQEAFPE